MWNLWLTCYWKVKWKHMEMMFLEFNTVIGKQISVLMLLLEEVPYFLKILLFFIALRLILLSYSTML